MHDWSETDFDWAGLNDCCDILYRISRIYGRLGGQIKEKYGSLRFYAHFGYLSLHCLVYPGYVYSQFPDWLWKLDCNYIAPFLRKFFEKPFVKWQIFWYNRAYQMCLKKHPHLRAEILCQADHVELIKGASRREGRFLYILGWKGETIGTWETCEPLKEEKKDEGIQE